MKTCPMCNAKVFDVALTCFECLYSFRNHSVIEAPEFSQAKTVPKENPEEGERDECQEPRDAETDYFPDEADGGVSRAQEIPQVQEGEGREKLVVEFWQRGKLRRIYSTKKGSIYLGSESYNDIFVPTKRIARRQLHLYIQNGMVFAELLDESHPIYLNGKELEGKTTLSKNDALSFADIRLILAEKKS